MPSEQVLPCKTPFTTETRLNHVNIVCHYSAYGLAKDGHYLASILRAAGFKVTESELRGLPPIARLRRKLAKTLRGTPLYDMNMFVEIAAPSLFDLARVNVLIPNPEFLRPDTAEHLGVFDAILCKTLDAQRIFLEMGLPAILVGFSTPARYLSHVTKEFPAFLHAAGGVGVKGTDSLTAMWMKHPEWPVLTVTYSTGKERPVCDNIRCMRAYVPEDEFRVMQNAHGVHLCPSEMEGFGHYIVEPMSAGSVVVATDAPPMNELVTEDRGYLVKTASREPHMYGTRYTVDETSFEAVIESILAASPRELAAIGQRARQWYLENDRLFRERLPHTVQGLL
jgi:hypothetical protein